MDDIVRIEVGIEQADALVDGLDFSSRIALGQIGEIANLARSQFVMVRDDAAPEGHRPATADECDEIEALARRIAAVLGHHTGHFGIGARGVGQAGRRQYEIKKAVEAAVAHHRQPGGRTNRHDGVTVRYTRDDVPTARMVERAR